MKPCLCIRTISCVYIFLAASTNILWQDIPGLLESLNGRGAESSSDLEHGGEVVQLQSLTGYLQDQDDDGTSLLGVVWGEHHFGDPFRHLVEPGDDVADVRG